MRDAAVKLNKPFKLFDIILYSLLVVLVVVLFVCGLNNQKTATGFEIYFDNSLIFDYDFNTKSEKIYSGYENLITKTSDFTYKIETEYGYNIIEIDNDSKTVAVTDTDCGISRECVHMSIENGVIICAPHRLKIQAKDASAPPRIG